MLCGKPYLVTGPTIEPVTVTEAKLHARIDDDLSEDDGLIASFIRAARHYAEAYQHRQLLTATWRLALDSFCATEIELHYPPLQSVSSIQYSDLANVTQTLATSEYEVDIRSQPGRVRPVDGKVWPSTYLKFNAVTITYVAGYSAAGLIPEPTKTAIKMLVAHLYENREASIDRALEHVPLGVHALLSVDRVYTV